ncbi:uncharacterized protein LOC143153663, partial [Ptiloglossa arizonensis]|uniref:uncharacterized protein LOC143153663 n=1 Tax=Ptiloglossa arizonensis TaxID=3350558 RepID=UPI003FA0BD0E
SYKLFPFRVVSTNYLEKSIISIYAKQLENAYEIVKSTYTDDVEESEASEPAEKIVGGSDAKPGQFPYTVSLRVNNGHVCGGCIINHNHILTAAHCVTNAASNIDNATVVSGTIYLSQDGESHKVSAMYYTANYTGSKDIGVIKIVDWIRYNAFQQPIPLGCQRPPADRYAVVSGWGGTTAPPSKTPTTLQYLDVKMISSDQCQSVFSDITTEICTLNSVDQGICSGDSGSPLVYNGKVVGVASRAVLCGKGYPDIFTSVYDNLDFAHVIRSLHLSIDAINKHQTVKSNTEKGTTVFHVHNMFKNVENSLTSARYPASLKSICDILRNSLYYKLGNTRQDNKSTGLYHRHLVVFFFTRVVFKTFILIELPQQTLALFFVILSKRINVKMVFIIMKRDIHNGIKMKIIRESVTQLTINAIGDLLPESHIYKSYLQSNYVLHSCKLCFICDNRFRLTKTYAHLNTNMEKCLNPTNSISYTISKHDYDSSIINSTTLTPQVNHFNFTLQYILCNNQFITFIKVFSNIIKKRQNCIERLFSLVTISLKYCNKTWVQKRFHIGVEMCICFVSADDAEKIVGGQDAKPAQFPYTVSLRMDGQHNCGGSILSNYHILTAAHCAKIFEKHIDQASVASGSIYLNRGGNRYRVAAVYIHPGYYTDHDKDIAIMKLTEPINFNNNQQSIALPTARPPENVYAVVSGYGYVSSPPSHISNTLRYLDLKIIEFNRCKRFYYPDLTTAICTLDGENIGICSGDSGSPLVYNNQVVGLVSRTVPCAKGYPDIFTSVYDNIDFVHQAMRY